MREKCAGEDRVPAPVHQSVGRSEPGIVPEKGRARKATGPGRSSPRPARLIQRLLGSIRQYWPKRVLMALSEARWPAAKRIRNIEAMSLMTETDSTK